MRLTFYAKVQPLDYILPPLIPPTLCKRKAVKINDWSTLLILLVHYFLFVMCDPIKAFEMIERSYLVI